MYKPLFLGINNGTMEGWLVIFGILIFLIVGLIVTSGVMVYFTVRYIIKLIYRMRKTSLRNRQ